MHFTNTHLFNLFIGDIGNKFYIILKGKINIFKTVIEEVETTFEEYIKYAGELYKRKEIAMLNEMKYNNKSSDYVRNNDLDNLEETIYNIKFRKVRIFSPSIAEAAKLLVGSKHEENKEEEKKDENQIDIIEKKTKQQLTNEYMNDIIKVTNSTVRKAKRLSVFSPDSPYRTSMLKNPEMDKPVESPGSPKQRKSKLIRKKPREDIDEYREEEIELIPRNFNIVKYYLVTTLVSGDFFGESALESRDNQR